MTQRSYAWSAPSLTRNRALPNTLSLEPTLSQQICPIDVLLKEASPTLLGHFSASYSWQPALHSRIQVEYHTILLSPDCTSEHFLSPHESGNPSRTEAFIITVAPGTELIFIKHFLVPDVVINNCLIYTTERVRCFYYTLLTYEETRMKKA